LRYGKRKVREKGESLEELERNKIRKESESGGWVRRVTITVVITIIIIIITIFIIIIIIIIIIITIINAFYHNYFY